MSIITLLSSQQNLKGNEANIKLAKEIARTSNHEAVDELINNLNNKDKNIQSDCIKTLYETAYINPDLIKDHYIIFLDLLKSKNNRMVWGSMVALSTITGLKSDQLFRELDLIWKTIQIGSVITIDCGVMILAQLNTSEKYFEKVDPLLTQILWECPIKQLPMYMEKSLICVNNKNKDVFRNIIQTRKTECDKESQVNRLNKVLKKIN